jgi:large subunit ribosomal protein L25
VAEIVLNATVRKIVGRKSTNEARKNDMVPGVFYLGNEVNTPLIVNKMDLRPIIYTSKTHVIKLVLDDGTETSCIIKDVQFDPVTDNVVHFDLIGLVAGQMIKIEIPILLTGTAVGAKEGGLLQQSIHRVEVECLPKDIPAHIELDVTNLNIGDSLTMADITLPNVNVLLDDAVNIASVATPRIAEEEEVEEEGEEGATEPEVVGEEASEEGDS